MTGGGVAKSKRQSQKRATAAKKAAKQRPRTERPARPDRWEAERQARRRRARFTRIAIVATLGAIVLGLVGWQVNSRRHARAVIASFTSRTCDYDTRTDPGRVNEHTQSPVFTLNPPSGGVHEPNPARAGTFTSDSAPTDGQIVHALEHGLIAIWYRPDLASADVSRLEAIAGERRDDVLLLPRDGLPSKVAATAWHRRLLCSDVEPQAIERFADAYKGKGPENVTS